MRTTLTPPNVFIDPLRELVKEGSLSMKTLDRRIADVLQQWPQGDISVSVDVTKTGSRKGDGVVQLYVHDEVSSFR